MGNAVVLCHTKSLSIEIDRVVQVISDHHGPKVKKAKVVGKYSISDSIQIQKPKNHQKTSKVPEAVFKKTFVPCNHPPKFVL